MVAPQARRGRAGRRGECAWHRAHAACAGHDKDCVGGDGSIEHEEEGSSHGHRRGEDEHALVVAGSPSTQQGRKERPAMGSQKRTANAAQSIVVSRKTATGELLLRCGAPRRRAPSCPPPVGAAKHNREGKERGHAHAGPRRRTRRASAAVPRSPRRSGQHACPHAWRENGGQCRPARATTARTEHKSQHAT